MEMQLQGEPPGVVADFQCLQHLVAVVGLGRRRHPGQFLTPPEPEQVDGFEAVDPAPALGFAIGPPSQSLHVGRSSQARITSFTAALPSRWARLRPAGRRVFLPRLCGISPPAGRVSLAVTRFHKVPSIRLPRLSRFCQAVELRGMVVGRARCPQRTANARRCPILGELDDLPGRAGDSAPDLPAASRLRQHALAWAAIYNRACAARNGGTWACGRRLFGPRPRRSGRPARANSAVRLLSASGDCAQPGNS